MSNELPLITLEFLNSELAETSPNFERKRGGPYSKYNRFKRRNDVFRLHFEEGHSIIKIAEKLKINRHTISKDIKFGYQNLSEQWNEDIESLVMKQVHRLDIQRTRFLMQLDNQNGFQERIVLERIITDIDYKISQIITKVTTTHEHILNLFTKYSMNLHESKQKQYWLRSEEFVNVSNKTRKKICELIKEDLEDPENYLDENNEDDM